MLNILQLVSNKVRENRKGNNEWKRGMNPDAPEG
jgi:hypothetical protein